MIVRIMGEGQFEMPEESLARLNELDDALEAALDDEQSFPAALTALLEGVRRSGTRVPDEELFTSDVVLPAAKATAAEVRELLTDEGLIPD
ncbi:MAG TPA: hypothetical protein PK635_00435 [Actinomycetota bacterium]|nr:hypothetical protein [Actinomycetota bacterium]